MWIGNLSLSSYLVFSFIFALSVSIENSFVWVSKHGWDLYAITTRYTCWSFYSFCSFLSFALLLWVVRTGKEKTRVWRVETVGKKIKSFGKLRSISSFAAFGYSLGALKL